MSSSVPVPIRPEQCLALAWFYHRRFESLTPPLGIRRFVLSTKVRKPFREILLSVRTVWLLLQERPKVVLVQNPSLICTLLVALLQPLFRYRIIVDAHGDAVIPYAHNWALVRAVTFYLLRITALTIVTNSGLAERVRQHGGRPFVLFDNLPEVPALPRKSLGAGKHVMFISTYASDEPHAEVFQAAEALAEEGVVIHVTGRVRAERMATLPAKPRNVQLTGFLSEQAYWELLTSCDVVLDLTTMPDCLVCGAYEAIGAKRALILSDNGPSRELFGAAAVYTQNTAPAITVSIRAALKRQRELEERAAEQASAMQSEWNAKARQLTQMIGAGVR
jgi:hypothetical protein